MPIFPYKIKIMKYKTVNIFQIKIVCLIKKVTGAVFDFKFTLNPYSEPVTLSYSILLNIFEHNASLQAGYFYHLASLACVATFWLKPLKVLGLALVKVVRSVWIQAPHLRLPTHTERTYNSLSKALERQDALGTPTSTTAQCTNVSCSHSIRKRVHLFCSLSYLFYLSSNILFISV